MDSKKDNFENFFDVSIQKNWQATIESINFGYGFTYILGWQVKTICKEAAKNFRNKAFWQLLKKKIKKVLLTEPASSLYFWSFNHYIRVISFFLEDQSICHRLEKLSLSNLSEVSKEIISVNLNEGLSLDKLTDEHLYEAIFSTLFYPLRQTIGACFATSVVIFAQNENLNVFFDEILHILQKNNLKRVIDGKEFSVPINTSIEKISFPQEILTNIQVAMKNIWSIEVLPNYFFSPRLLKCFEYTVASMTEYSLDSHASTLYVALGINPKIISGLGIKIYDLVEKNIQKLEKQAEDSHIEAQQSLDQINRINSQLSQASSYEKIHSLKSQGYTYSSHMNAAIDRRDDLIKEAEEMQIFYKIWNEQFVLHLKEYFQEIYDPELINNKESYEDSPAGFRLMCKHGRQSSHVWTKIYEFNSYFLSLKEFFVSLEHRLFEIFKTKKSKKLIEDITSLSIQFIQEEDFEKNSLKNLKDLNLPYTYLNPWSYISGGTLKSVLSCFLGKPILMPEIIFYPKDAMELLVQLVDFFKDAPFKLVGRFINKPYLSLLMQSETHAFCLKPGLDIFYKYWSDQNFSYTKIRDYFFNPIINFYKSKIFTEEDVQEFKTYWKVKYNKDDLFIDVQQFDIGLFLTEILKNNLIQQEKLASCMHEFLKNKCSDFPKISSIPFADTNWAYYYFSFIVNPISLELEIWRESIDGIVFFPMIEWGNQFTKKHGWHLYLDGLENINFSALEKLKFSIKG